ncbi:hypothetical protein HHI36_007222 [Cryptolaemus montrouzieri]|uniref:Uncharacterized protein n=1 Tax=Cryptolaemus montrouzieri TaxID=559131 RepID=A0ABD2MP15_9CUCU
MTSKLLLIFTLFANAVRSDDYVDELGKRCNSTRRSYSCTKYKLFDYLDHYSLNPDNAPRTLGGFVRFVKMGQAKIDTGVFQESRHFGRDSEVMKIVKFLQRKADRFLGGQGLAFSLPDGAEILEIDNNGLDGEEGRGKKQSKKSKEMLIPLIMLFKLFKIKVLVSLVLLAVLFIKKTILLTAMFLPSVIQSIKNHCKLSYHVVPHHVEEEHHEHDLSGTGWGYSGYGHGHDWDKSRLQRVSLARPHYLIRA